MKKKAIMFAVLATTLTAGLVLATQNSTQTPTLYPQATAPTCASVHFGMDDATLQGDINLANSDIVSVGEHEGSIGVAHNISMTAHEVVNQAVNAHSSQGLKLSSAKKSSTLILTFGSSVSACDIYAVGWANKSCYLKVNGGTKTAIASNASVTGTSLVEDITYVKYHFDFSASATLTLEATERVVIGDIALRLA